MSQETGVRIQKSEVRLPGWALMELAAADYLGRMFSYAASMPEATPISVPSSWAAPIIEALRDLEKLADSAQTDGEFLAEVERLLQRLPLLYAAMDHDALAGVLESGLAAGVVNGANLSLSKMRGKTAAQDRASAVGRRASQLKTFAVGFETGPLAAAVAKLDAKTPLAIALRSDQWDRMPLWIRERSQFSARVESARLLQAIQNRLGDRLSGTKQQIAKSETAAGGEAFVDRSSFIAEMRAIAIDEGIETTTPNNYGTVRDIRSAKRLGLI
jgi:hypothetical protein